MWLGSLNGWVDCGHGRRRFKFLASTIELCAFEASNFFAIHHWRLLLKSPISETLSKNSATLSLFCQIHRMGLKCFDILPLRPRRSIEGERTENGELESIFVSPLRYCVWLINPFRCKYCIVNRFNWTIRLLVCYFASRVYPRFISLFREKKHNILSIWDRVSRRIDLSNCFTVAWSSTKPIKGILM